MTRTRWHGRRVRQHLAVRPPRADLRAKAPQVQLRTRRLHRRCRAPSPPPRVPLRCPWFSSQRCPTMTRITPSLCGVARFANGGITRASGGRNSHSVIPQRGSWCHQSQKDRRACQEHGGSVACCAQIIWQMQGAKTQPRVLVVVHLRDLKCAASIHCKAPKSVAIAKVSITRTR